MFLVYVRVYACVNRLENAHVTHTHTHTHTHTGEDENGDSYEDDILAIFHQSISEEF